MCSIPVIKADINSVAGDGWPDIDEVWFAKTRHGGAGGFRASVGIDPASSSGQDGWFAGGWTWTSGTTYHFNLVYEASSGLASLYVDGINNDNALCQYVVGPSMGKVGIIARSSPEIGMSTVVENLEFNGIALNPDDSITATSSSGEDAKKHVLITGADLTQDFIINGDYTFNYGSSTWDEAPAMYIQVENSEPCIPDIPVNPGYDPDATCSNGARWRNFRQDGNGWELAVGENIGSYESGWANLDFVYAGDYYFDPAGPNIFTYTYDAMSGDQTIEAEVSGGLFTQTQNNGDLGPLNYLQFDVVGRNGQMVEFNNVMLTVSSTTYSLCNYEAGGWLSWYIDSLDLSGGFSITGEVWLTGQAAGQEHSKINVCVGRSINLPPIANANGPYFDDDCDEDYTIFFDGSNSYDPEGTLTNWTWNMGDGTILYGEQVTHTYSTYGQYLVSLNVSDGELFDTDSTTVEIYAVFADAGGPYIDDDCNLDHQIVLDASASYGYQNPLQYDWKFFEDDVWHIDLGPQTIYDYPTFGLYNVQVRVTEPNGCFDIANTTVEIFGVLAHVGGPYESRCLNVKFDASASYGYQNPLQYDWKFFEDDVWHIDLGPKPSFTYQELGSYIVCVRVTEFNGCQAVDCADVGVICDEMPPIVQVVTPEDGDIVRGVQTIYWYAIDDTLTGEDLPIYIYYSNNMIDWFRVGDVHSNNIDMHHGSYEWDTNNIADGEYFLLVEADGTGGLGRDRTDLKIINNGPGMQIDTNIHNKNIDNGKYVKNGDKITITAAITGSGSSDLTRYDIVADLQGFGYGSEVVADEFNGFIAEWNLDYIQCDPVNGEINVIITVSDQFTGTASIIADNTAPLLSIDRPSNGLYFYNTLLFPLNNNLIIIGPFEFKIDASDENEIEKVILFIDDVKVKTMEKQPYEWYMNKKIKGKHQLDITAYDVAGNYKSSSFEITFFNLIGI